MNVRAATDRFPKNGYGELKRQMISAAESIVFTIVEGCGAESGKEFARFLAMSIKSSKELEGELEMAHAYRVLRDDRWQGLAEQTIEVRRMLYSLRKTVLAAATDGASPRAHSPAEQNTLPPSDPSRSISDSPSDDSQP